MSAVYGCSAKQPDNKYSEPAGNAVQITASTDSFLAYSDKHIDLSVPFIGLDTSAHALDRGNFLQQLTSGRYLPMRLTSPDTPAYRLYPMPGGADTMVAEVIKNMAALEYRHFKMEGSPLKDFGFTDIAGERYTPQNTAGKIVVLKCWFIKCHECVEEMPVLNKLVEANAGNPNVVFISLALDPADKLRDFLTKTAFKYAVVPDQQPYIIDKLGIFYFPTHIIIGRDGNIFKIVNKGSQVAGLVQQLLAAEDGSKHG